MIISKRIKCKDCNSSDGLAVYKDATYCFACNKLTKYKTLTEIQIKPIKSELKLPLNCITACLPKEAHQYLFKYFDFKVNNLDTVFWSNEYNRLCFPFWINDIYVGCWMRCIYKLSNHKQLGYNCPKWLYAGNRDFVWLYSFNQNNFKTVILVEDIISALKIKFLKKDVICLGGTKLKKKELDICKCYERIIVFLDGDKAGKEAAQKIRNQLKLNCKVQIIRNKKDPKEYTNKELERILF